MLTWERLLQNCLKAPRQLISLVLSSSGVSINILMQIRTFVVSNTQWKSTCRKIHVYRCLAQINYHYTHPGKASSITSVFCERKTLSELLWKVFLWISHYQNEAQKSNSHTVMGLYQRQMYFFCYTRPF